MRFEARIDRFFGFYGVKNVGEQIFIAICVFRFTWLFVKDFIEV